MLAEVQGRTKALGLDLQFDASVVSHLARVGFDAAYGARPLRRAVVRLIEDALSGEMLEGKIRSGDTVTATVQDNTVIFKKN